MSIASSPRQDIAALLGRRFLAVIPKDQLRLLEQPDSWAADFKNKPHGQAHIPGHVLETTKQAYRASSRNEDQGESGIQNEDSHGHAPASSAALDGMPSSSPERSIPWSQSPSRSRPPQQAHVDSSVIHETPKSASFKALPPPTESQRPQDLDSDDAMSSNDEDDLEMALPQAQVAADPPVNMAAARLAPTPTPYRADNTQAVDTPPPCAQPSQPVVIPATAAKNVKSCPPQPSVEGRRHRHKLIVLNNSTVKPVASATAGRRMPATKMFADVSGSHDTTSSSMVPATSQDSSVLDGVVTSIETTSDLVPPAPRPEASRTGQGGWSVAAADAAQPTHPGQVEPLVRQAVQAWATEPATHEMNPYRVFAAEYPDYVACHGGSLWNFVRACVCVDYLRRERMLRECLFDDFVRAFSVGYLQYVARAGPGQEPLPAIEWFNLLGGAPLYNRMVVSRKNLDAILAAFPEEVKKARNIIRDDDDDDDAIQEARPAEREPSLVTGPMPSESPEPRPAHTPRSAIGVGRLETPSAGRRPSRLQTPPVPRPPSPQLGSDGPVPPSAAPTPSASARSKRPPLSQYLTLLTTAGRLGSARKRSAEDQERLREHFRRRKLSGKRSVASSS
ncbi:hypothetical protein HRG_006347 [Hirsutella rhossiliensis]|uniref:Uncharacterized protein n=1 Tax=Hirsutella rhossiliensis TaxID=111463 RepID=A0A9P8MVX0_9HYPO|nr:uncharacterized protein HRG_06347 [Hirsutella rhossiliensis]KAH0962245.1 hypothetical protein HRG_06347 [Hirsutella rhossiliensis]